MVEKPDDARKFASGPVGRCVAQLLDPIDDVSAFDVVRPQRVQVGVRKVP